MKLLKMKVRVVYLEGKKMVRYGEDTSPQTLKQNKTTIRRFLSILLVPQSIIISGHITCFMEEDYKLNQPPIRKL
jgi:hypothetical protein